MKFRAIASTIAKNWRLKGAAFTLSLFLWALIQADGAAQRTISVPVTVQFNDPGWMIVGNPSPAMIEVQVSGPAREVFRLGFEGPPVTIPIHGVSPADTVVVLQNGWIPTQAFPGVQVEDIVPSSVRLRIERERTKVVAVRLSTLGTIPNDLALTRAMGLNPNVVRVTGPESVLNALDTVDIVPVDLGGVTVDGVLDAMVDVAMYQDVVVVPDQVLLRVPVEESMSRVLSGVPVEAASAALGGQVEVIPASLEVRLEGARSRVATVGSAEIRIFVPLYALQGLGPTEERRVPVLLDGVPSFVSGRVATDTVVVRRSVR